MLDERGLPAADFPLWTLLPFPVLVLAIAVFPIALKHLWERHSVQAAAVGLCVLPVAFYELRSGQHELLEEGLKGYLAFAITLGALFTASGGILFFGLFLCLVPIEVTLARIAPSFPVREAWQLFWGTGLLSSVLDNAPTYTAFAALARGLSSHSNELVAGIAPLKLAAISAASVVMGATTYIGNGPNLMVKAVAERERYRVPSFARYCLFAFTAMLPAHLIVTAVLYWLER